jgi:hypothetical protein
LINLQLLEANDIVLPTDWCRPLYLETMSGGHSDYYSFEDCYTNKPENNTKWCKVSQVFHLVLYDNETVKQYNRTIKYEFVRGNIPWLHQYGKTKPEIKEDYLQYLANNKMRIGKYKGKSFSWVKSNDKSYFEWAIEHTLIKQSS